VPYDRPVSPPAGETTATACCVGWALPFSYTTHERTFSREKSRVSSAVFVYNATCYCAPNVSFCETPGLNDAKRRELVNPILKRAAAFIHKFEASHRSGGGEVHKRT
jgi:hypothetical protein